MKFRNRAGAIALSLCLTAQLLSGAALAAAPAEVTLTALPETAVSGSVVTLTASAAAVEGFTLSYEFFKNDKDNATSGTSLGAAGSAAIQTTVADAAAPYYYVIVTSTKTEDSTKEATTSSVKKIVVTEVPITALTIKGIPNVGKVLTLDALMPANATVTYQWQRSMTLDGVYTDIDKQMASSYTIMTGDMGYFLRLQVAGAGSYAGKFASVGMQVMTTPTTVPTITAFAADKSSNVSGEKVMFTITATPVTDGMLMYAIHSGAKAPTEEEMKALTFVSSNKIEIMPIATAAYWAVVKNERTVAEQDQSAYTASANKVDVAVRYPIDAAKITLAPPVAGQTPGTATLPVGMDGYTVTGDTVWTPADKAFASGTVYTAKVTLTANETFFFTAKAVASGAITVDGATAVNKAMVEKNGTLTFEVVFPAAGIAVTGVTAEKTADGKAYTMETVEPAAADVAYQWQYGMTADGDYMNIPGATSKEYTAAKEYESKFLRLMVMGKGTYSGVAYSAGMKIPATLGGMVAITGMAQFNNMLTADLSGVLPTVTGENVTYQWTRAGVAIDMAKAATYTLVKEDIGKEICVVITGVGPNYGGMLTSTAMMAERANAAAPMGLTSATPTAKDAKDGKISGLTEAISYEYMLAGGAYMPVTPKSTEIMNLMPGVYAVRYAQTETHKPSAGMTVVISNFEAIALGGTVSITGNAIYSQTLTAKLALPEEQMPENTVCTWYRDGAEVGNGMTYLLTTADVGKAITLKVLGKNDLMGMQESAPTALVSKADPTITLNAGDLSQYTSSLHKVGATLAPMDSTAKLMVEYQVDNMWKTWENAKITDTGSYKVRVYTTGGDGVKELAADKAITGTLVVTAYSGGGGGSSKPTVPDITTTTVTNKDGTKIVTSVSKKTGEITAVVTLPKNVTRTRVTIPVSKPTSGIVAAMVDINGKPTIIKKSLLAADGITIVLTASANIKIMDNGKKFSDATGHWAGNAVMFVTARELFNGTSDISFSPDMPMTRGMLATVLYRLEEGKAGSKNPFGDVPTGMYYTDGVAWAAQKGIVNGMAPDQFGPDDNITREQLVAMLYRYAKIAGVATDKTGSTRAYPDSAMVSDWAMDAMKWAVNMDILTGDDSGNLSPGAQASRAEVSTMLQRFMGKL